MGNAFLWILTLNARKLYEIELYFLVQWQLVPNISHMLHSPVASEAVKSYFSAFLFAQICSNTHRKPIFCCGFMLFVDSICSIQVELGPHWWEASVTTLPMIITLFCLFQTWRMASFHHPDLCFHITLPGEFVS